MLKALVLVLCLLCCTSTPAATNAEIQVILNNVYRAGDTVDTTLSIVKLNGHHGLSFVENGACQIHLDEDWVRIALDDSIAWAILHELGHCHNDDYYKRWCSKAFMQPGSEPLTSAERDWAWAQEYEADWFAQKRQVDVKYDLYNGMLKALTPSPDRMTHPGVDKRSKAWRTGVRDYLVNRPK